MGAEGEGREKLSTIDFLELTIIAMQKLTELLTRDLRRDIDRWHSLNIFDQTYLRAYWEPLMSQMFEVVPKKVDIPAQTRDDIDAQVKLIEDHFGVKFDSDGRVPMKANVTRRLEWLKQSVAKEFEDRVVGTIERHEIASPIEQIFLMEWLYARVEEQHGLKLEPQKPIRTDEGQYYLDFLVTPTDGIDEQITVAIELDGHEFHEKTKDQALADKRRERAILRAGVADYLVVLRFTGREVVQNCKQCIGEVIGYVSARRGIAG